MTIRRRQGGAWVVVTALRRRVTPITFGRRRVGGAWVDWWGFAASAVTFSPATATYNGPLSGSGTPGPTVVATAVGGTGPFTWTAQRVGGTGGAQMIPNFTANQPGNTLSFYFSIYGQTSGVHRQIWRFTATNAQGSVYADIDVEFDPT